MTAAAARRPSSSVRGPGADCAVPAADPAPRGRPAPADRPVVVGILLALFVLSIAVTAWRHPDGVVVSRDPGYAPMPVLLLLVPALAAMALTAQLPRGRGAEELSVRRGSALRAETAVLLGLVLAFPLLVPLLPTGEDYVLVKAALFLLVP